MTRLEEALRRAVRDLEDLGARYALVGGLAVSVRAEPRLTRDVDLAVAVRDDAEAESLVASLRARGYRVQAQVEQEATARLATVRLRPPGPESGGLVVDLLFASSGIEAEIVAAADVLESLPGLRIPVASRAHLLALKILAMDDRTRPQDRLDAVSLLREAAPQEIAAARASLASIQERGFGRDKNLCADLEKLLDR